MGFADFLHLKEKTADFEDVKSITQNNSWKIFKIMAEFVEGYDIMANHVNEVTIFGSARTDPSDPYYQEAVNLGYLLGSHNFTTITGGGPGIMKAANKGAFNAGGTSIGLGIELPHEQQINPFVTHAVNFSYFFTRKVMLTSPSQAFVYFPGGYGTLDEFFQVLHESALGFTQKVPIVLVGHEFWDPLMDFLKNTCVNTVNTISSQDLENIHIVDTSEEAFSIIRNTEDYPNLADISPGNIADDTSNGINWRIFKIMAEFVEGLDFLSNLDKNVTLLGTNKISSDDAYYDKVYALSRRLALKDYNIVTGGGQGIAEAANKASRDADKHAYAIVMALDDSIKRGTQINDYVDKMITCGFPFTRQFILTGPSTSYVYCPGGLGTLHQLFEVLTLVQTGKVKTSPLVMFDEEYWQPLLEYIDQTLNQKFHTINPEDIDLYTPLNKEMDVVSHIDKAFQS